jgi:tetratricopeptide (TPR) repeat protein
VPALQGSAQAGTEDQESTSVEDGPPQNLRDRWEEKTFQEGAARARAEAEAEADSKVATIDRGAMIAGGTAGGQSTLDEPTMEDQARPLPPLALVPTPAEDSQLGQPTRLAPNARLLVIGGNDRGREFAITDARTAVGRGVDNDIILTDIAVSRRHLIIEFEGGRYTSRDLDSGNGTLVNGERLATVQLRSGDQLELGNTLMRFEHPDVAAETGAREPSRPAGEDSEEVSTVAGRPAVDAVRPALPLPSVGASVAEPGAARPPLASLRLAEAAAQLEPRLPAVAGAIRAQSPRVVLANAAPPQRLASTVSGRPGAALAPSLLAPRASGQRRTFVVAGVVGVVGLVVAASLASLVGDDDEVETKTAAASAPLDAAARPVADPAPRLAPAPVDSPTDPAAGNVAEIDSVKAAPALATTAAPPPREPAPPKNAATAVQPSSRKKAATEEPSARVKPRPPRRTTDRRAAKGPSATSARKKATALYKAKDFTKASDTLLGAAERAHGDEAKRLAGLASDYAAIGANLDKGNRDRAANPPAAMAAYRRALDIDRRAGGQHATFIRMKLGDVAPKAAATFMAQRRYEAAKRACDEAVNYGAGTDATVARVRQTLERKAASFYQEAYKIRKSKPAQAQELLKRVLKIVPSDSPWYVKSDKALATF